MTTPARNAQTAALEALIEAHAIELKLPTVRRRFKALAAEALREQQTPIAYLAALLEAEMAERAERRRAKQPRGRHDRCRRQAAMGARRTVVGTGARAKHGDAAYVSPAFCTPLAQPWFRREARSAPDRRTTALSRSADRRRRSG